ncbi:hypothetical protein MES5069_190032 [Mesorhizobium escarrei]|uniref:C-type cytochrome n=1 Tax=Mesorhizobium escarrei TaxID=666018 RepID=A0ABN8JIT6_9HYPH|nr:hypothetical protein MES5069_190032 [Mesorhizobium escarrei]
MDKPLSVEEMQRLAPPGRYLAQAADCAACHTAPGGAPGAGGLAFPMPFERSTPPNFARQRDRHRRLKPGR